jgi:transcriptional regulator with XRE-family HTH domain
MSLRERQPPQDYYRASRLLGERVAALRSALGWSQEGLAERTGLSRNQIQNIEKNRNNAKDPVTGLPGPGNARLDTIFLLADALGVTAMSLIDPAPVIDAPFLGELTPSLRH